MSEDSKDFDLLEFVDGAGESLRVSSTDLGPPWKVLVVDDDDEVHRSTAFAIAGRRVLGRTVELLHARSAGDAVKALYANPDVAVAFVDVVMESERAGLDLVDVIRNEIGLAELRIVLRTGQPGFAPEIEAVTRYDINDYHAKTDLTQPRLVAVLTTALRAFDQLRVVAASRAGLESIALMAPGALEFENEDRFLEELVERVREVVPAAADVALLRGPNGDPLSVVDTWSVGAGTGRFAATVGRSVLLALGADACESLEAVVRSGRSHVSVSRSIASLALSGRPTAVLLVETTRPIREHEAKLLDVLAIAASAALANVEALERLDRLAHVDASTSLLSRAGIERAIAADDEDLAAPRGVVVVDVDRLRDVHDTMGPRVGEAMVFAAAERLRRAVPDCRDVARLDGSTVAAYARPFHVAGDAIVRAFEEPLIAEGVELSFPIHVGLASAAAAEAARIDLISAASLALSAARASGKEVPREFTPGLLDETRVRMARVVDLRRAIENGELELHYQPQVDLLGGRMVGVESLVRWRKRSGELVPPLTFIELAEQSGLIIPIGDWVLREACRKAREWEDLALPPFRVAVNVSVAQFRQPDFPSTVRKALEDHDLAPARLELELTESLGLEDVARARKIMEDVRALGVTWAIDDFGIGYSSLGYVRSLPVSRIKIDRAFTSAIRSATEGIAIPRLILELARDLDFEVVAEGIETAEIGRILADLGCRLAQGYYYAKPLVADDLVRFVRANVESTAAP